MLLIKDLDTDTNRKIGKTLAEVTDLFTLAIAIMNPPLHSAFKYLPH